MSKVFTQKQLGLTVEIGKYARHADGAVLQVCGRSQPLLRGEQHREHSTTVDDLREKAETGRKEAGIAGGRGGRRGRGWQNTYRSTIQAVIFPQC